jgi:hypothetical protein
MADNKTRAKQFLAAGLGLTALIMVFNGGVPNFGSDKAKDEFSSIDVPSTAEEKELASRRLDLAQQIIDDWKIMKLDEISKRNAEAGKSNAEAQSCMDAYNKALNAIKLETSEANNQKTAITIQAYQYECKEFLK